MNEEVKNNENKKKQKIVLLIGLVTLLIAVLGATYAYFQISTDTESSNTNITGSTPPKSLVTLKPGTDNLHLNISASDMSLANANNEYYATDVEAKSYEDNESDGTKTIASVELTGGEATTKYSCTAKLTVSKVTEPDEDKDTMIDVLHSGDMILQFKGNIISNGLDLSDLKETGSKEYNLKFNITGNTPEEIKAYIKLINKDEIQNYLSGKKLNIDVSTSELKCNVYIPDPKIAQLRADDSKEYLSEDIQGGMYRYQAAPADEMEAAQMTNWICFGTTENCGTNDDDIDKYMYRIIGITVEGQMYLIKETVVKEGTNTTFTINSESFLGGNYDRCASKKCGEWPESLFFKRINGLSNGSKVGEGTRSDNADTDIFVDSEYYDYLRSGDKNKISDTDFNDSQSEWYKLIDYHLWLYGEANTFFHDGHEQYDLENGVRSASHYVGTYWNSSTNHDIHEEIYFWNKTIDAKIGLPSVSDYLLAYYDGVSEESRGNPDDYKNTKNSWIHFKKDGYNLETTVDILLPFKGIYPETIEQGGSYTTWGTNSEGGFGAIGLDISKQSVNMTGKRPVFYLESSVKIADGDGTKSNPYIIDVQE